MIVNENRLKNTNVSTEEGMNPTALLSVAIRKRRSLTSQKKAGRDLRREVLVSGFIQSLCKHIGEQRAARKRRRFSDFESSYDSSSVSIEKDSDSLNSSSIPVSEIPLPPEEEPSRKSPRLDVCQLQETGAGSATDAVTGPAAVLSVRSEKNSSFSPSKSSVSVDHSDESSKSFTTDLSNDGESSAKRVKIDESDPFGLDEFFRSIKSISCR